MKSGVAALAVVCLLHVAADPAAGREVEVGLYLVNLGKLDVSTGSFTADFYLSLKSKEPIPDSSFEFVNGRAASTEKLEDKQNDAGTYEKFYRILANLTTPMNLKKFPFDSQQMQIIIEDKTEDVEKMRYVPARDECGLDASITFPGWRIVGWDVSTREHEYPVYGSSYSQFVYTVNIKRMAFSSFLKTFLPVIFLMLIVMSSFILNPEQVTTRLGAISSSLVASAMFHISISNQVPPMGYLTFADKFMILTYFILLASFFLSIAVFILQGKKATERAQRLNRISERLVIIGMPALYVTLFLVF